MKKNIVFSVCFVSLFFFRISAFAAFVENFSVADAAVSTVLEQANSLSFDVVQQNIEEEMSLSIEADKSRVEDSRKKEGGQLAGGKKQKKQQDDFSDIEGDKVQQRKLAEEKRAAKRLEKDQKSLEKENKRKEKQRIKTQKAEQKNAKALSKAEKELKSKQKTYLKLNSKVEKDKLRLEQNMKSGSMLPLAELEAKEKIAKQEIKVEKTRLEIDLLQKQIKKLRKL